MFDLFYFQAPAVKESRVREAMRQRKTMREIESTRAGKVYGSRETSKQHQFFQALAEKGERKRESEMGLNDVRFHEK